MTLEALGDTETWVGATAKQIARAVRRGDASATEVVADHLAHITARESVVRAFRLLRAGEALAEADAVDAQEELANLPLAGVPVAVKENTQIAGLPTWNGSAAARTAVAEEDHEVVRRLRGAGAVVVATSRAPEMCIWPFTDDADAVTRNPWRTDRTPGGSSGGAAAAVAAGLVPIAHGNDGLGSVRIPAAACGLVGVKPGRGVVPANMGATDWFGLAEHGILATTVADATVGLAVLAGWTPPRLTPPERLRVAVSTRSPVAGVFPDNPAKVAVASATKLLIAAGHDAVYRSPSYPTRLGFRAIATWCAAVNRDVIADGLDREALQPRTRRHAAIGAWAERHGFVQAEHREQWRERCLAWFSDHGIDVLLTPALASSPPEASDYNSRSWLGNLVTSTRFAPYAAPWNVAGFPALVVPMGVRPDGLPVGVQLVGPPGAELKLLAVAGQLEEASPWLRHAPGWPAPGPAGPPEPAALGRPSGSAPASEAVAEPAVEPTERAAVAQSPEAAAASDVSAEPDTDRTEPAPIAQPSEAAAASDVSAEPDTDRTEPAAVAQPPEAAAEPDAASTEPAAVAQSPEAAAASDVSAASDTERTEPAAVAQSPEAAAASDVSAASDTERSEPAAVAQSPEAAAASDVSAEPDTDPADPTGGG